MEGPIMLHYSAGCEVYHIYCLLHLKNSHKEPKVFKLFIWNKNYSTNNKRQLAKHFSYCNGKQNWISLLFLRYSPIIIFILLTIDIIDKIKDSMLKSTKRFEILNSPNYLRIVVGKKEGEQALKWNIIIVIISLYPSISQIFYVKKM